MSKVFPLGDGGEYLHDGDAGAAAPALASKYSLDDAVGIDAVTRNAQAVCGGVQQVQYYEPE